MMRAPFFPWAFARKGPPAMDEHSHTEPPSEPTLRIKALESLLVEKGLVDPGAVDEIIELFEKRIGPRNGAKVVARAWADPAYKKRLLEDGSKAIAELGFSGLQGEDMVVLENTPSVHNVVVCTLCSCYPWPTMGRRPTGTRPRRIAPASSSIRARCSPSSASTWRRTSRCAFGTATPISATWCCRCGPPAPTAGAKKSSSVSS